MGRVAPGRAARPEGVGPHRNGLRSGPVVSRKNLRQPERHDAITEWVMSQGTVRIDELAEGLGVSSMTVHRDLDALAAKGLLRKSRGVVTAVATSLFEASVEYRTRQAQAAKEAVAQVAFSYVEPGQALILDDSTTGLYLARLLPQRQPLTVITNFQDALNALTGHPGIALIALGGQYYQWCDAYMGAITINALQGLRADVFFMSTSAITDDICFHQHHDTVLVKRAMFEAASTRILYADHSKFGQRALHALGPLSEFDVVVLDAGTVPDDVARLQQAGVNVVVPGAANRPRDPR